MRKSGLKISTFWKSFQKLNATSIFGFSSMEWNALYNENKIMSFLQKFRHFAAGCCQSSKTDMKKQFYKYSNTNPMIIFNKEKGERCLKCIKYFLLKNIHESACREVQ